MTADGEVKLKRDIDTKAKEIIIAKKMVQRYLHHQEMLTSSTK